MQNDFSDKNAELGALYPAHLETICSRYDDAMEKTGAAHAVIFSGAPHGVFQDDQFYPYRAAAHFLCWAPQTALPFSYIVYTPGEKPVLVYFQPRDYWHVVPGTPDGYWTDSFDIRIVHTHEEVDEHLPAERDKCVLIGEVTVEEQALGIERINPQALLNILDFARGQKTAYELACMRLANVRGALGHVAAEKAFRDGKSELDIHRAYCRAVDHTDNELPYGNIVALNTHGAVLHYTELDREAPGKPLSFLIDAGAQVHGYASDITRTYSFGDKHFADLIERMEQLQLDVVGQVKAGLDYKDLHIETHRKLADVLVDVELASGSTDSLLTNGVTSAFLPHGLGHLLGTQVHDVGGHMESESGTTIDPPSGHPFLRLTRVLQEDMVLTIEPGLYIIDMLLENLRGTPAESQVNWETVDRLRPFGGIRIEDNVRVLDDGSENFTRDAFAALPN